MPRRLIAVVAAYAVVLQAVLASFAVVPAVGAMPGLCASGALPQPGSEPGHAAACLACPALCCDGLAGVAPAGTVGAGSRATAVRIAHPVLHLAERSAPRNLPPSRASPVA
jgi:hypothetical protein